MLTNDPLAEAREHGRRLRAEAAAERLAPRPTARHLLAEALRRTAERLDPTARPDAPALGGVS